jgi:hypothetical protein
VFIECHSCRSPNSFPGISPYVVISLPPYFLSPKSLPHNLFADPHSLTPVVSIFYENMVRWAFVSLQLSNLQPSNVPTPSAPSPILRTLFQVPYPVTPVFATLTKTAGVYTNNSRFSSPRAISAKGTRDVISPITFLLRPESEIPTGSARSKVPRRFSLILFFSSNPQTFKPSNVQPFPASSFLTSHGIITCRKITGSGQTFTCRPRCPPCGLIQASFGTSPLFKIK